MTSGVALFWVAGAQYNIRAEKDAYYLTSVVLTVERSTDVQITLRHVQEFHETVSVSDSPPLVDPARTESSYSLTNRQTGGRSLLLLRFPKRVHYQHYANDYYHSTSASSSVLLHVVAVLSPWILVSCGAKRTSSWLLPAGGCIRPNSRFA